MPGTIQPHGMHVVVDPHSWRFVQASGNATTLLGHGVRAFTVERLRELGYDVLKPRAGVDALNLRVQLITKPFALDDLAARIRGVLNGQDPARHAT